MVPRSSVNHSALSQHLVLLYSEKVNDLLESNENLKIKENVQDHTFYSTALEIECNGLEKLKKVVGMALQNRATSATTANNHSSRSHAILSLVFTHNFKQSKIKLVDLAGAEQAGANYSSQKKTLFF